MRNAFFLLVLATSSAAAERSITKDHQDLSISCADDAVVTVSSNHNTLTIVGACKRISILGNNNTVTIASTSLVEISGNNNTGTLELADRIDVPGNDNTVTYRGAVTAKARVKVSTFGSRNKVKKVN